MQVRIKKSKSKNHICNSAAENSGCENRRRMSCQPEVTDAIESNSMEYCNLDTFKNMENSPRKDTSCWCNNRQCSVDSQYNNNNKNLNWKYQGAGAALNFDTSNCNNISNQLFSESTQFSYSSNGDDKTSNSNASLSSPETCMQPSLEFPNVGNNKLEKELLPQTSDSTFHKPLESKETGTTGGKRQPKQTTKGIRRSSRLSAQKSAEDARNISLDKSPKRLRKKQLQGSSASARKSHSGGRNKSSGNLKTEMKSTGGRKLRGRRAKKSEVVQINLVAQEKPIQIPKGGEKLTHRELFTLYLQFHKQGLEHVDKGVDKGFQIECYNPENVCCHNTCKKNCATAVERTSNNTNQAFQNESNETNLSSFPSRTGNSNLEYEYHSTSSSTLNNEFYNDTNNHNNNINNTAAVAPLFNSTNNIDNNNNGGPGDFYYHSVPNYCANSTNDCRTQVEPSQMWNYNQQWESSNTINNNNTNAGFFDDNVCNNTLTNNYYSSYDTNYGSNNYNNNFTNLDVCNSNVGLPPLNSWYNPNGNLNNLCNDNMLQDFSLWDLNNNDIIRDYNYPINSCSDGRYENPGQTNSVTTGFLENTNVISEIDNAMSFNTCV